MSNELGEFLRSRRAQIQPEDVGFRRRPRPAGRRTEARRGRCAGLRERRLHQAARGRQDPPLRRRARLSCPRPPARRRRAKRISSLSPAGRPRRTMPTRLEDVRPGLLRLLAAVEPLPAFIVGPWLDLLAWNPTASALFCGFERRPPKERNMARLIFLDPEIRRPLLRRRLERGRPRRGAPCPLRARRAWPAGPGAHLRPHRALADLPAALGGARRREEDGTAARRSTTRRSARSSSTGIG